MFTPQRLAYGAISSQQPLHVSFFGADSPGSRVGNALYWLSTRGSILEFDFDGHSLAVIEGPPVTNDFDSVRHQIM